MNYFAAISKRADELNELGRAYLDPLPFMSNDAVCQRLFEIAKGIDLSDQENPEWVDEVMDGYIRFSVPLVWRNGSIYFMLGHACAAQDARLRNLLEVAEGRETQELDLATLAEKEIVESYCS